MDVVAPNLILFFVCWIAIGGGVGALIGSSKGRGPLGFVLGLLLGIIGWIIMAVLSPTPEHAAKGLVPGTTTTVGAYAAMYRECPHCKEQMRRDARLCPHCRTESEPWMWHEGRWWVTRGDVSYYLDPQSQQWLRYDAGPGAPPPAP